MSKPNCHVCGGVEFAVDAGFYYCSECQTQSQEIREFVFDEYFAGKKAVTRVLKTAPAAEQVAKEAEVTLTSWEILNYILKGLVDEIIELGAKPELKCVVLQLWACYLRRLEVAYLSTSVPHMPRLDVNFRSGDAEIVYGVTTKQMKQSDALSMLTSKSRTTLASSCSNIASSADTDSSIDDPEISRRSYLMRLSAKKKALALAEYQSMSQESLQNSNLEDLGSVATSASKRSRIKLTKHARNLLKKKKLFTKKLDESSREDLKKVCRNESMRTITVAKLIALLRLALLITKHDIYTSDIFRWVADGHLSVLNCKVFLPKEAIVRGGLKRILEVKSWSSSGQKTCMSQVCSLLGISNIPVPDLTSLAMRYCKELQLPDDFAMAVCRVVTMLPKKMFALTTNYEVVTMSVIIGMLKMTFSLDDRTEDKLSHFAKDVGRSCSLPLFVWNDWVQYIQCRKHEIAAHHFPTYLSINGNTFPYTDPEIFRTKNGQKKVDMDGLAKTFYKESKAHKMWKNQLKRWLEKLDTFDDACERGELIQFPPSLTPLYTYTQTLLEQYPHRLSAGVKSLLSQDFTKHSVEFVFNPNRFVSKMADHGIKISIHNGPSVNFHEMQFEKNKSFSSRTNMNKQNESVRLIVEKKQKGNKDKNSSNKNGKSSDESVASILNDDLLSDVSSINDSEDDDDKGSGGGVEADKDSDKTVSEDEIEASKCTVEDALHKEKENKKAYTLYVVSTKVWHCHIPLKQLRIFNDEFETKAMEMFPCSFLWLLRECARMINVSTRELYTALISFEKMAVHIDKQKQTFKYK